MYSFIAEGALLICFLSQNLYTESDIPCALIQNDLQRGITLSVRFGYDIDFQLTLRLQNFSYVAATVFLFEFLLSLF